jgi:tetratricopeptide (TPR) repeat protein
LSRIYFSKREYDKGLAEGKRAVALNPGATIFLDAYGSALKSADRPEEAIPLYQKAIRLNPLVPSYLYLNLGFALRMTGRREEAVSAFKNAIQVAPNNFLAHIGLAATYSAMGREKEARAEADEVLSGFLCKDNYE